MRWLVGLAVAVASFAAAPAHAAPLSNPAFLGIAWSQSPGVRCVIDSVTPDSGAEDAGLRGGDIVLAIDGVMTPSCDVLSGQILTHSPGDRVHLDVVRGHDHFAKDAMLSTPAEVLQRRLVGHPLETLALLDADAPHDPIVLDGRGRTIVTAWFSRSCLGCARQLERTADALAKRFGGTKVDGRDSLPGGSAAEWRRGSIDLLGILPLERDENGIVAPRRELGSTVPLALADDQTFHSLTIADRDRLHFIIIDCHGLVQFASPIAPDSDDIDAAVDEVLAAVEQADHARTPRR